MWRKEKNYLLIISHMKKAHETKKKRFEIQFELFGIQVIINNL